METLEIARRARQHAVDGQIDQARQWHIDWLEREPEAFEPLVYLARLAAANGRLDRAIALFERARGVAADSVDVHRELGIAYRRARRNDEAVLALSDALRIDSNHYLARLHLAAAYEGLGRKHDALVAYFSAVSTAQSGGQWRSVDSTPAQIRPLVEHAISVIDRDRAALLEGSLAPLRARYGAEALRRVDRCLATYLGSMPTQYADPRQKPTFLYFPDLPATPWFERDLFPWYEVLESQWQTIRDELCAVMADTKSLVPFMENPYTLQGLPYLGGTTPDPKWDAYFFYRHGQRYDDNCERCPVTAKALDAVPIVRVRDHAPECLYSVLSPGASILSHRGVTNTRTVTHLPLIVPGNGALRVAGEDREWQEGRCISFDDTFLHEAWNHSEQTRVVLLLDSWNPHLTDVESSALAELVAAIGDFSAETRVPIPGDA